MHDAITELVLISLLAYACLAFAVAHEANYLRCSSAW
jgi:hypothetical protein